MKIKIALIAGFAFLIGSTAFAQTATPKVNKIQRAQKARIIQGRTTGKLTPRETKLLRLQQAQVQRLECRAKADGVVTLQERVVIKRKQRVARRTLSQKLRN